MLGQLHQNLARQQQQQNKRTHNEESTFSHHSDLVTSTKRNDQVELEKQLLAGVLFSLGLLCSGGAAPEERNSCGAQMSFMSSI